jgi:hypothetical protein
VSGDVPVEAACEGDLEPEHVVALGVDDALVCRRYEVEDIEEDESRRVVVEGEHDGALDRIRIGVESGQERPYGLRVDIFWVHLDPDHLFHIMQ